MMDINLELRPEALKAKLERMWDLSARKIRRKEKEYDPALGSPVFTAAGKYTTRGWTEWTQGFEYGGKILQFDATGDEEFLDEAKREVRSAWLPT